MYGYIYIYLSLSLSVCLCVYIYIYINERARERERERERERASESERERERHVHATAFETWRHCEPCLLASLLGIPVWEVGCEALPPCTQGGRAQFVSSLQVDMSKSWGTLSLVSSATCRVMLIASHASVYARFFLANSSRTASSSASFTCKPRYLMCPKRTCL